tara:strand:- start:294 stop:719 length:426 start_codon:yes stop_codon:yes gene_type:complete
MSEIKIKTVKDAATTIKLLNQKILLLEKQVELQDVMIKKMVEQQNKKDDQDFNWKGQHQDMIMHLSNDYMPKREVGEQVYNLQVRIATLEQNQAKLYETIAAFQEQFPEVLEELVSKAKKDVVKQYKNRGKRPLRIVNPFR